MNLKKIYLLLACTVFIKPINNNIKAAIPSMEKKMTLATYYDFHMLKHIEDSLKVIDPRNSITPKLARDGGGLFFGVEIYSNIKPGDQENVTTQERGRKKNRCIAEAFKLANVITPCAYNRKDALVGVRYIEEEAHIYLGAVINLGTNNNQCASALSFKK